MRATTTCLCTQVTLEGRSAGDIMLSNKESSGRIRNAPYAPTLSEIESEQEKWRDCRPRAGIAKGHALLLAIAPHTTFDPKVRYPFEPQEELAAKI